ncbi:C4-type Zn-finger protein [Pseudomonas nitritireducens]|uniref:C4-type Zn-finger protein n=1 Tax=Pseudomonas nitroreducens TaxID=46680 RepID=A0A7W7KNT5_PSENT|nr:Ig-like domain-containing protein [Pseudomonas nitritireducens]MBB4865800.1 C4-type Zn-finger protein [Pseudomonas nitritireducens]
MPDGKFILADQDTGIAPENITVRRSGKNLLVFLEGESFDQPSVIIEDFFEFNCELIGMAEGGEYYAYVSSNDDDDKAGAFVLQDGESSALVLGGAPYAAGDVDYTAFGLLPWIAGGALGAGAGLGALNSNKGGSSKSEATAPVTPEPQVPAAPAAPELKYVLDNVGSVQGAIQRGDSTDDTTPTFKGEGRPGDTIIILDKGEEIGRVEIGEDGTWEFTPKTELGEGSHDITLIVQDPEGKQSEPSDSWEFQVDTTAPDAPAIGGIYDDVGVKQGELARGDVTDDRQPTLSGTAEKGALIEIFDNGVKLGETRADSNGQWSFTPAEELGEGSHSFTARATDAAGNSSDLSTGWDLVIDFTPPTKPDDTVLGGVTDNQGPIQGPIEKGGSTDDTTPTFNGKGEPGDTIIIRDKGEEIGRVEIGEDGTWEFTPETDLGEGDHEITVIIQDPAGNQSEPSDPWEVTVDTTAPDAPVIGGIYDNVGIKQGELVRGEATDDRQPTLHGTAEEGSLVEIFDNGVKLGEARADGNGQWTFTPSEELDEGQHSFTVSATDAAGNTSDLSTAWDLVIDFTPPSKPDDTVLGGVTDNQGPIQGPVEKGGTTDDTTPTFNGKGEPGDTIIIRDKGEEIGRVEIGEDGTWEFTPKTELEEGDHEITVIIQDPAGNQSEPSDPWEIHVDSTAPDAPVIGGIYDNVGIKQGELVRGEATDDRQPTLSGTAEEGSLVEIFDNGVKLGEARADSNGQWTFTPSAELDEGQHSFTVSATDAAGNTSDLSTAWDLEIDFTPPAKPDDTVLGGVTDNHGPIQGPVEKGGTTDDTTPTFNGKGEPGDTIIIQDKGEEIGRVEIGEDGTWEFTPKTELGEGEHEITVIVQDPAGNQSEPSDPWEITIDTTAPDAPVIGSIYDDVGDKQGELVRGEVTDDTRPTIRGTAEAGSTVVILDNGKKIGEAQAGPNGEWTFTPETQLSAGKHAITAQATDAAGNTSAASEPAFDFTLIAPNAPTPPAINSVIDNVGSITGPLQKYAETDDARPTLNGSAEPNVTIHVYSNGELLGTTQADSLGMWSFTPAQDLSEGLNNLTVNATDLAGNLIPGSATGAYPLVIDTTNPNAVESVELWDDVGAIQGPILAGQTTDDAQPTFRGKTDEGNVTVVIYDNGVEIGRVASDAEGNWSFTPNPALVDGDHALSTQVIDRAGNVSDMSEPLGFTVDTHDVIVSIDSVMDNYGVIQGPITANGVTDDTTPTLSGRATANATVVIYDNGVEIGRVQSTASGTWSFTPEDSPLGEGEHALTVTVITEAGGESLPTPEFKFAIDITAPDTPDNTGNGPGIKEVIDDVGPIQGPIQNGGVTDDTTPTLNGTGVPGDTVLVYDNGTLVGSAPVGTDGTWSFTPPPMSEGEHAVTIVIQDPAGNQSKPSAPWVVTIDTIRPDAPVIGGIYDDVGVKQGELARGDVTDDRQPTLSGTAEEGSLVEIFDNGVKLGETRANSNGQWTFTPSAELDEGQHSFTVRATDAAGNTSDPSAAWDLEIDFTPPSKPDDTVLGGVTDNHGPIQGPVEKGGTTDDTTPTFNGKGEPGDTIIIQDKGEEIGRVEIGEDGTWEFTPKTDLGEGDHEITVIVQDPAGNQSEPSDPWEITIDTTAPDAPVIGGIYDDVGVKQGELTRGDVTDDRQPTLSGTAEEGSLVEIFDNGVKLGEARADSNGQWTFTPSAELDEGQHSFTVRATDAAGNTSDPSTVWDLEIDFTPPSKPDDTVLGGVTDDHGPIQGPVEKGGTTDDTTPTFNGKGEPGDTIIIQDKGEEIGRVEIGEDGTWEFTPKTELGEGEHEITVIVQDPAGNQSEPSDPWEITIDTTAPDAPVIGGIYDDVGEKQGELEHGDVTDDTRPTIRGTAEAGSTVVILDNGKEIGRVAVGPDGNWSFTPEQDLSAGGHAISAQAMDAAGNVSEPSSPAFGFAVSGDMKPSAAVIESIFDDVGPQTGELKSGDVTDDTRPQLSGHSDAGAIVVIYSNGVELGRTEADAQGRWSFTPDVELSTGEYSFSTVAINAAGNSSDASEPFDLIIYTGNGPTQVARLSSMGKDSGTGNHDFVTNNDSFGRAMYGTLSAELNAGQRLQVSTDGGQTWFNALVNGTDWAAQDLYSHNASWNIQTRVVDQNNNAGYVLQQNVVLDKLALAAPTSVHLADGALDIAFNASGVAVGDRIAVVLDGGAARFEHTLTQSDINAGAVHMDVGSASSASVAMVDVAGNLSGYTNTAGAPNPVYQLNGDVSEVYGLGNASVFSLADVNLLQNISLIEGNAGTDTLRLTGANQTLDLSAWQGRLSSVEIIDITGSGDNTLKLSLGDVLDLGHRGAFINDESVQLAVKGNAGDKVMLDDLLPNGMNVGDWELLGDVTAAGVVYDVYHHSDFAAEILVQQGVSVQL